MHTSNSKFMSLKQHLSPGHEQNIAKIIAHSKKKKHEKKNIFGKSFDSHAIAPYE